MNEGSNVVFSVSLPIKTYRLISSLSFRAGISKPEYVRELIKEALDVRRKNGEKTFEETLKARIENKND